MSLNWLLFHPYVTFLNRYHHDINKLCNHLCQITFDKNEVTGKNQLFGPIIVWTFNVVLNFFYIYNFQHTETFSFYFSRSQSKLIILCFIRTYYYYYYIKQDVIYSNDLQSTILSPTSVSFLFIIIF